MSRHVLFDEGRPTRFTSSTALRMSRLNQRKYSQIKKSTKSAPTLSKKTPKFGRETKKLDKKIKKRQRSISTFSLQSYGCFERQPEKPKKIKNFKRFSSITTSRISQAPQRNSQIKKPTKSAPTLLKKTKKPGKETNKSEMKIRKRQKVKSSLITLSFQSSSCFERQQEKPRRLKNFKRLVGGGLQNKFSAITASRLSQIPPWKCPQIQKPPPTIYKPSKIVIHRYPARKQIVRKFPVRRSREDAMNIFASKMQNLEVENNLLKNKLKSVTKEMNQVNQRFHTNKDHSESQGSSHVAETTWAWVNNERVAQLPSKTMPGIIPTTLNDVTKYLPGQKVPEIHPEIQKMYIKNKLYDTNVRDWHETDYNNRLKNLREENKMLRSMSFINKKKESLMETMMPATPNEKIEAQYQRNEDARQKLIEALRDDKNELEKRLHDMEQLKNEQHSKNRSLENDLRRVQATNESLRISLEAAKDDCRRVEKEFESYKLKLKIMMSAKDIEIQSIKEKTTSEADTKLLINQINTLKKKRMDSERLAKDLHEDCTTMKTMIQDLEARSAKADKVFSVLREALKYERSAKRKFETQCASLREKIKSLEKGGNQNQKQASVWREDSEIFVKKHELNN